MKENRWLALMAFIFGLILFLGGLFLFGLNTYYSALGMIELTYGKVDYVANVMLPTATPIDGGRLGLLFGIVFGLVANAFQFVSIILRDKEINKGDVISRNWLITGDIFFRGYDYVSTIWYLTNGFAYFALTNNYLMIAGQTLIFVVISILGISTGSEIFLALGLRMIYKYGSEGFNELIRIITTAWIFIKTNFDNISSFNQKDNKSGERDNSSFIPVSKGARGRPPKNKFSRPDKRNENTDELDLREALWRNNNE